MTKVNYTKLYSNFSYKFPLYSNFSYSKSRRLAFRICDTHTHTHTHTHTGEGAGEGGVAEDARGAGAGGGGGEEAQSGGGGAQTAGRAGNNNNNNDDTVRLFSRHLGLVLVSEIPRATKMVD